MLHESRLLRRGRRGAWLVLLQEPDRANKHVKKEGTMKVMVRSIMKAVPGKMAEAMELEQKHMAIASRVLGISARLYRPLSGGGDLMNTIISEGEFDSLAAFEVHPEKAVESTHNFSFDL